MVNAVKNEWLLLIPDNGASRSSDSQGKGYVSVGESANSDALEKSGPMTRELMDYIRGKMQEIYSKIKSGDTEKSYAIGGASYTEKEWERLIEEFDAVEETIKEEIAAEILTAEKVKSTHKDRVYITFISSVGIYCKREGSEEYKWKIEFDDSSQYDQVTSVLNRFDKEDNLRFADSKYFWQDVLSGVLDVEDFVDFWNKYAKGGNIDCTVVTENGVRMDPETVKYARYLPPDFVGEIFYSLEDLMAFRQTTF